MSCFSVVNSNSLFESILAIYRAMASAPSELLEAKLDKANDKLEHWTLELKEASAALERGKEKGFLGIFCFTGRGAHCHC